MNILSIRNFRTLAAALALTLTVAVPAMQAQSYSASPDLAVVNVPFGFEIGSTHFAAGQYTLTLPSPGLLLVRGNANSGLLMSRGEIDTKPSAKSVAVFHKAGGKYFLAELHTAGSTKYVECIRSSEESRARKTDLALNSAHKSSGAEVATVEAIR